MGKKNEVLAPSNIVVLVLNDSVALDKLMCYVEKEHLAATSSRIDVVLCI